jgi:isocitrate dehydrogenase
MEGGKIKVTNPVVDMDGDEMTRIIWHLIKEKVLHIHSNMRIVDIAIPRY